MANTDSDAKVLYEKRGEIAYITLNRPEAKNAIDFDMHDRLGTIWDDFRDDKDIRVAILTGTGDAFTAGADLKQHLTQWVGADAGFPRRKVSDGFGGGITRGKHRITKPIIAAVNGWALAGGFEIALAADIRIASEKAQFGSFEVRRGLHPMDGAIVRLVNMCGLATALDILLSGDPFDAHEAHRRQIVAQVVPHDELMDAAEAKAASILRNDQAAIESAKDIALDIVGRRLDDALTIEALLGYGVVASNPSIPERLGAFYDRTDQGRVGG
jgi:enoyl-CoA hydratase/carnithine racemase